MKKFSLLVLTFLLCMGFAQAQDVDEEELKNIIKAYEMMKANKTPKQSTKADQKTRYEQALINAAKKGNDSQVRGLLEQGINPNVKDTDGNTPLIYAAKVSLPAVDMLLFAGADVNAKGYNGLTPLINSLHNEQKSAVPIIKRILQAKPDMNAIYRTLKRFGATEESALSLAVTHPYVDAELFAQMLKQGADAKQRLCGRNGKAEIPLSSALASKDQSSLKKSELLLQAGADPYLVDNMRGKNPLYYAKQSGDQAKIKLIKDAMAVSKEQNKKDKELINASRKGNVNKVKKLLAEGANPNAYAYKGIFYEGYVAQGDMYARGDTPLTAAKNAEVAKILLDAGANINSRKECYCATALFDYDLRRDSEKDKLLIKAGADLNVRNVKGFTPLVYTILYAIQYPEKKSYFMDKAWLLLKAGADPSIRDNSNYSALLYANYLQDETLIQEIMRRGVRLSVEEQQALTNYLNKQAQGGNDIGNTLIKGLVNTGMSALEYNLTK